MIKAKAVALAVAILLPVLLGAAKCQDAPPPHGPKKVQPAPNPDPAPRRSGFPGNVSLTFWLDQDAGKKTVTSWNVGAGRQTHYCTRSCHWLAVAKPGQLVTATTDYYALGERGWLKIQVVQNNNGRILCQDDNSDSGRSGGLNCSGTVVI